MTASPGPSGPADFIPGAPPPGGLPPTWGQGQEPYAVERRLYRSTTDRVWAGVCGGLAEHYGWDPSVTRIGYAILALFTGIFPMLILYIVMAMVIPNGGYAAMTGVAGQPQRYVPSRAASGPGSGAIIFGALLIVAGGLTLLDRFVDLDWDLVAPTVVIGLGVLLVAVSLARQRAA